MTTIDGAVLTDEMLEQIREWQVEGYIDDDLHTIDKAIDMILELEDIQEIQCADANKYLHLFFKLRYLAKNISKFRLEHKDDNKGK